jgi:thymidylate kinase
MIVIVEGPDNVGKGTQIVKIKKWLEENSGPVHVLHYSNIKGICQVGDYNKPHDNQITGQQNYYLSNNEKIEIMSIKLYDQMFRIMSFCYENGINLILDRAHLGETVYSPIFRSYDGDFVYAQEQSYTFEKDALLFLFTDQACNLIHREDGFSFSKDLETKQKEIIAFEKAYERSSLIKKHIDVYKHDENDVWENFVKPFLEENKSLLIAD